MPRRTKSKDTEPSALGRRGFLKAATLAGTGAIASAGAIVQAVASPDDASKKGAPAADAAAKSPPSHGVQITSRESEQGAPPHLEGPTHTTCGSDFMVDVMRNLGIEYVAAIPGNTFKGLHESIINYGMMTSPALEHISCMHEEISVAISHGYAKISGKPMACMMHSTVGLQHGSMAIYNAWADRVPVFAIVGAQMDAAKRRSYVDWQHSVFDGPALVRDFTKFDDTPISLSHFAESANRAHKFSMTPPYGPVLLAIDQNLQEDPIEKGVLATVLKQVQPSPPRGDDAAVLEVARLLVAARSPLIVADRAARTPHGLALMVELAEALQAPVVDMYGRMNFPWRHPLNQTRQQAEKVADADVILGLELTDFWGVTNGKLAADAKRISITSGDLYLKANYQDFERFTPVDIAIAADAEATLPYLIEAIRKLTTAARRSVFKARGAQLARDHQATLEQSREAAAVGWDAQPITTARMCAEVYEQIRNEDWALCNGTVFQNYWPQQLWTATQHHQYIGDSGAYGLGYLPGATVGAALAHRKHGRLAVAIGGDGDLMFTPGALWTAAHHKIPLLYVVHNNRAYHQEVMYVQMMANKRNRGIDRAYMGNAITDPNVDFSKLANGMGVYAEGPVTDPKDLGPALKRAVAIVKRGEPALVDVVSQGR
ncbi:MAG: acetolactate synthase large subunit [Gammaproteobacteria bacterium]|jgi:thiamine pyrophosphate-dependent acetolactate synthase large subunit-like protein|nr:acetolactate synthase large subunit [Gammaproteobacteria bacterium]